MAECEKHGRWTICDTCHSCVHCDEENRRHTEELEARVTELEAMLEAMINKSSTDALLEEILRAGINFGMSEWTGGYRAWIRVGSVMTLLDATGPTPNAALQALKEKVDG